MNSSVVFNNYSYGKNGSCENTIYYRCSKYKSGCKARLIKRQNEMIEKGTHTCGGNITSIDIPNHEISPNDFINNFLTEKSTNLVMASSQIYQNLLVSLRDKYINTPYIIPSKSFIYSQIRTKRGLIGMNAIEAIASPPLSLKDNGQPFFRRLWIGDIHGEQHRIIIWITNECLSLLRYNTHTFIDVTFKVTPHPFYQCVIVMTYDCGTRLYVPCAYALVTCKNEYIYCELLHQLIVLMEYNWMPRVITTDFEKALISAVKHEFPESRIIGCYFHLKQALQRKLIKFKMLNFNSTLILNKIELLTIVPQEQISAAIQYIKEN